MAPYPIIVSLDTLTVNGQVGDQTFFQSGQRLCRPHVIAQGLWQTSLSVQDARELAVRARRSFLRVNPPPGAFPEILLPRPSELCGVKKISYACDCQFARHISLHTSPCQLVFEPSKCPSASTETSVRSKKKKKKQKNSKKNVQRRTERRRQQQRGGKFQRASLMFFSYTRINCRYGLAI